MTGRQQNLMNNKLSRLALEIDMLEYQIQNAERLYEQIINSKDAISQMHWLLEMIRMEGDSEGDAIELAEERCPGIEKRMLDICEKLRDARKKLIEE